MPEAVEEHSRPRLLGVLNITPDSFSDGGQYLSPDAALQRACLLWEQGADWVDVGAESTRPGAPAVSVAEELRRLEPVFAGLKADGRPWSIDSQKPEVLAAAVAAGVGMLNDVNALQAPGALEVAASCDVPVVLMHRQGNAQTMQAAPAYSDVLQEVEAFLLQRRQACLQAGIAAERIILDPGIGFGKTLEHNLILLRALSSMRQRLGAPILLGVSRKSLFRDLLGLEQPEQRIAVSAQLAAWAAGQGVDYLRVHDVPQTVQALRLQQALEGTA